MDKTKLSEKDILRRVRNAEYLPGYMPIKFTKELPEHLINNEDFYFDLCEQYDMNDEFLDMRAIETSLIGYAIEIPDNDKRGIAKDYVEEIFKFYTETSNIIEQLLSSPYLLDSLELDKEKLKKVRDDLKINKDNYKPTYQNKNTFIDWQIYKFLITAGCNLIRARQIDVVLEIFCKFKYEHYRYTNIKREKDEQFKRVGKRIDTIKKKYSLLSPNK